MQVYAPDFTEAEKKLSKFFNPKDFCLSSIWCGLLPGGNGDGKTTERKFYSLDNTQDESRQPFINNLPADSEADAIMKAKKMRDGQYAVVSVRVTSQ